MSLEIPLINDLKTTFPESDVINHFDNKMIEMYENFTSNKKESYTDKEIYDYIKFINLTCLDSDAYKHIIQYITKDNINIFFDLFDNYDIAIELIPLLKYDIVCQFLNFENNENNNFERFNKEYYEKIIKIWIIKNLKWIFGHNLNILKPYIICELQYSTFYLINDKVYGKHKRLNRKIRSSLYIIKDIEKVCKLGELRVLKYIIDIYIKEIGENYINFNHGHGVNLINICKTGIYHACKYNHLDIVKYIVDFLISKNINIDDLHYQDFFNITIINNNIELFKYIFNIFNINPTQSILFSIQHCKLEILKYLIDNCHIEDELYIKMLNSSITYDKNNIIQNKNVEMFDYIFNQIDLSKSDIEIFGYDTLYIAIQNKNNEIINYILNKLPNKEKLLDNYKICDICLKSYNFEFIELFIDDIITYIKNNFITLDDVFNSGYIKLIKIIIEENDVEYIDIFNILKYNPESECLEFIKYCEEHEINIIHKNCISMLINQGYLNILVYLYDNMYIKDISTDYISKAISVSTSEDDCLHFVVKFYNSKIHNIESVLCECIIMGYLKVLRYFYETKKLKYSPIMSELNVKMLFNACNFGNIEIVKYFVDMGVNVNYIQTNNDNDFNIFNHYKNFNLLEYIIINNFTDDAIKSNNNIIKAYHNNKYNNKYTIKSHFNELLKKYEDGEDIDEIMKGLE